MTNARILWSHLQNVVDLCKVALDFIVHQDFPPLCDYVLEATDAGPGVGVSNMEVKYKDIEISRVMAGLT
jgi:hypothetical protein